VVSKRLKARVQQGGTLVLDAQGLSLHVDGDEAMRARIAVAESKDVRIVYSAVTPLEVRRTGKAAERLAYLLSRFDKQPVSDPVVTAACKLLDTAGLDGHECLVDALVVATAALAPAPVRLITSDKSHIPALCKAAAALPGSPDVRPTIV
jgi:hypothetical protein